MKQILFKPMILLIIAWGITGITMLGYNPLSISWYGGLCMSRGINIVALPVMIAGIYNYQGLLMAMKYGLIMVATGTCIKMYKRKTDEPSPYILALITVLSAMAMEAADWSMATMDMEKLFGLAPIMMLTWSTTVIFSYAVRQFMEPTTYTTGKTKEISKAEVINNENMLRTSKAF